jgi:glycosyltransferase involved in cell wall biosynthesis
MTGACAWAIAIPARDEAERLGACLAALARQRNMVRTDGVIVVFANNCTDDTPAIARAGERTWPVTVIEHASPAGIGSAGEARSAAMRYARQLVRDDGILLTTDADAIADNDWIAQIQHCFADPRIDLVAGKVSGDWEEMKHHPQAALDIGALEFRYCNLLAQVEPLLDPLPHDPAPRHAQQCGANLAIRAAMFDAIGGVPAIPVGEDRALVEAVFARDGGIRHANAPHVTASARIDGRADGGMATALRERIEGTYVCDELVLPAAILERRLALRAEARRAFALGQFDAWAAQNGVPACGQGQFGSSWLAFLARRPDLAAAPLSPSDLPGEIARLEHLLMQKAEIHAA